ncbi:MAG: Crp/Fnr family transcriptional regulator [Flavobacteriales bacterium]|nr:Crp/Fnr family transcriptional regulator [Flavobacteriales bacterium]
MSTKKNGNPEHLHRLNELIRDHCTAEWRDLMGVHNERLSFKKGEQVFSQGGVADHMFMIHHGQVKVIAEYTQGNERGSASLVMGRYWAIEASGRTRSHTATVTALSDSTVNRIPMSLFHSVLKANNAFCYHFLMFFAEEMRILDNQLRDLMNMTVPQRVARALKMNMDAFGFHEKDKRMLAFTLSRKDIASAADTTYESVIRTLAEFQEQGIIELVGKRIRIRNKSKLMAAIKN